MKRECEKCVDYELGGYSKPCFPCYCTKGRPNFRPREKPMPKTPDPPTTEMIIEAGKDCEDCPDIKRALKKLWPGAFDESVEMFPVNQINSLRGEPVAWVCGGGINKGTAIVFSNSFRWVQSYKNGVKKMIPTRK